MDPDPWIRIFLRIRIQNLADWSVYHPDPKHFFLPTRGPPTFKKMAPVGWHYRTPVIQIAGFWGEDFFLTWQLNWQNFSYICRFSGRHCFKVLIFLSEIRFARKLWFLSIVSNHSLQDKGWNYIKFFCTSEIKSNIYKRKKGRKHELHH